METAIFISLVSLGLSWVIYKALLKPEKSLNLNRFYLLSTLMLCLLAPNLELDWGFDFEPISKDLLQSPFNQDENFEETVQVSSVETVEYQAITIKSVSLFFYGLVTLILVLRFLLNLVKIKILINESDRKQYKGHNILLTRDKSVPFSFFNNIFISENQFQNEALASSIITHELAHSKQLHSLDILVVEFLTCVFWFNPFVWLYKKEISENHEYLADDAVVTSGIDSFNYSSHLINHRHTANTNLFSGFSFLSTKNRIDMLHKEKSNQLQKAFKTSAVLLLFSAIFIFSSYAPIDDKKPFVVVIDAGHGGKDSGKDNEKLITLQVANYLAEHSENEDIEIILTRDSDKFLTLKNRVDFINNKSPNLLISLHLNSAPNTNASGFEAYISPKSEFSEQSKSYSKLLLDGLLSRENNKAKVKEANFYVLENSKVPSITLLLGFLSNANEAKKLNTEAYQKKLANDIYRALKRIKKEEK